MSANHNDAARPLSPYTIIEAAAPGSPDAHRLALSLAGKIAADLGATVIKIVPPGGDPIEAMPVLPWEAGCKPEALGAFLNSSKTLIALDLGDDSDRVVAAGFAATAQAILTDGPLAALDDGVERSVVMVTALPGDLGAGTPPLSEFCLLALSGLLDIVGDPARAPLMLGGHQAAYAAGFSAFSAMMTGLAGLENHGRGDCFDVDILDVLIWVNWKGVGATAFDAGPVSRRGDQAEWRTVQCKDGWMALVFDERDWPALVELIDHPALRDPALRSGSERAARRDDYMPAISAWCELRTRAEIYRAAQAMKIPFGPVVGPGELAADPQILARGSVARMGEPPKEQLVSTASDVFTMPLVPVQWNGAGFDPRPAQAAKAGDF